MENSYSKVPPSSILGPIFVLLHTNNLPEIISDISNPILFADDTSTIITNSVLYVFKKDINNIIIILKRMLKVIYFH
jgi:hypothetical protein